jgi:hypothetical protein
VACVSDAVSDNRQKSTLSEPFQFGLYVCALQISFVRDIPSSDGNVQVWRSRLVSIMKSKKLSFKSFCDAIGKETKCDPKVWPGEWIREGSSTCLGMRSSPTRFVTQR